MYYVVRLQKIAQFQIDTKGETDVNPQKEREKIMQNIRYFRNNGCYNRNNCGFVEHEQEMNTKLYYEKQ